DAWTNCASRVLALIDINTNTVDVMLGSRIKNTNTTSTSHLEEDVGIISAKLLISDGCTLGGVNKIIRITDHYMNAWVNLQSAILVAGDVADDRWNSQATYSTNGVMTKQIRHLGFTINLHLACYRANKATRLLLFKEERRNIGEILTGASFVCRVCSTT